MSAAGRAAAGLLGVAVLLGAEAPAAGPAPTAPYRVTGGRADGATYEGYRRYHAVCSHCHGQAGLGGSFAPGLLDRTRDFATFRATVLDGVRNGRSVMKGYAGDPNVEPYLDALYAYLAARRDGALGPGRPQRLP